MMKLVKQKGFGYLLTPNLIFFLVFVLKHSPGINILNEKII